MNQVMFDMLGGITLLDSFEEVLSVHAVLPQADRPTESPRGSCMKGATLIPCGQAQVDRPAIEKAASQGAITTPMVILSSTSKVYSV
jgi:hypothetical protein